MWLHCLVYVESVSLDGVVLVGKVLMAALQTEGLGVGWLMLFILWMVLDRPLSPDSGSF